MAAYLPHGEPLLERRALLLPVALGGHAQDLVAQLGQRGTGLLAEEELRSDQETILS
jgi:hypothetical protein